VIGIRRLFVHYVRDTDWSLPVKLPADVVRITFVSKCEKYHFIWTNYGGK